ncbi:hypothetical protein MKT17_000978 [Cronobacter sakazakii]|nr:hypothetical protein [Cronobacter sakazakii]EIX1762657.1 hypothetical protein [Cronobacter sakazakii]EIX6119820.1 hypothetical protein [Cronobacter sakazakii]EIX6209465.1 hypothetical protein [Cronobacter sakazakii]EJO9052830.1 hypothetical protein [Cronobacter sakazakii]
MKVLIDDECVLTIRPETGAEALALRFWCQGYKPFGAEDDYSRIIVETHRLGEESDDDEIIKAQM